MYVFILCPVKSVFTACHICIDRCVRGTFSIAFCLAYLFLLLSLSMIDHCREALMMAWLIENARHLHF